jgi:hypothetical protein
MPWRRHIEEPAEPALSRSPEEARARIRAYSARSRLGQWGLIVFLALSMAAFRFGSLFNKLPEDWQAALGSAPPIMLMSIALAVYAFSALLYILARMMEGDRKYRGWSHLGYLGGFYLFFAYADALRDNFWAILVAGLTILGLEHFRLWSHCKEVIRREREILADFDRCSRRLPSDNS